MAASTQWDDLKVRLISALVMAVVATVDVILGGVWFQMLVVVATAVMVWELWMMMAPDRPTSAMLMAVLAAAVVAGTGQEAGWPLLLLFLVVPVIGAVAVKRDPVVFFIYALGIVLAGDTLIWFRETGGVLWMVWLLLVVVMTDVMGYFAGRMIGGPKFWPKISPKKTWSGTVAGWFGAALVGLGFVIFTDAGAQLIVISIVISFASQMGDIAESALKRRFGVKDSSHLIPGHGGPMDRFDGLLGAALLLRLMTLLPGLIGVTY